MSAHIPQLPIAGAPGRALRSGPSSYSSSWQGITPQAGMRAETKVQDHAPPATVRLTMCGFYQVH